MDNQQPSTSQSFNTNRPSTSRGIFHEERPEIKLERRDSFDGIVVHEEDTFLSEEFARMETDRRTANQRGENNSQRPSTSNQRIVDRENQRNNHREREERENPRQNRRRTPSSARRSRHRSPAPSDPSESDSSSSEDDEYIPYFTDPIREADRLRELRKRRRAMRKDGTRRSDDDRTERHRRERRDRRRERERRDRSLENRNQQRRDRDERNRPERQNENQPQQQPQIIQIMIPYPDPAMMHRMHGMPRPMFPPYMPRPFGRFPPHPGMRPGFPVPQMPPMPPFHRPRFGARIPPPMRFPPMRFRPNRP